MRHVRVQTRNAVLWIAAGVVLVGGGGCVGIQRFLAEVLPVDGGGDGAGDGDMMDGDGDMTDGGEVPIAFLDVSNPAPQVNEQVILTCSVVDGEMEEVTFDFQPAFGRLNVNALAGRASFIVSESDIGVAMTFTCTATGPFGRTEPSNERTILPTAAAAGPG